PAVYILLYVCSVAVVLLTMCGNLLVIISVLHFKQLHTPTNMLVLSLAVSDFLIGALVMPAMFIWTIESCWIFGRVFCIVFLWIGGLIMSLSIYNIALIAVDRYLALSNPFLYTNTVNRTERKAAKVLGILVSVFLVCLLPYFIYSLLGNTETFQKLVIVAYLNSTINPLIYALFYPWFRRCMKLIITLQIFQKDSALISIFS
ncbi:trace amine-associated receptor 7e-like, partial [Tachysurus fulvidraco]|uniref:trace amine-associated receptor 7e-like n=1 Tax=Tachysurus fulvidraco TaxID=1234273 RepID=UPI001FEEAA52